ncbi:hypothetical protein GQ457_04G022220 [Hibiscus cannabinus]
MQITSLVEARRQEDQGLNHLFKYIFVAMVVYVSNGEGMPCFGAFFYIFGLEYRYSSVVSVPEFNTGIRVSVLLDEYRYPFRN